MKELLQIDQNGSIKYDGQRVNTGSIDRLKTVLRVSLYRNPQLDEIITGCKECPVLIKVTLDNGNYSLWNIGG